MAQRVNVVFTGQFKPGCERQDVLRAFAERFNLDEARAAAMLLPGTVSILKKATDTDSAERMAAILDGLGLVVEIQPDEGRPLSLVTTPQETAAATAPPPAAGDGAPSGDEGGGQQSFNPYARVAPKRAQGGEQAAEAVPLSQRVFEGAVAVPAGRGVSWITEGYSRHVSRNFGPWIGAVLVYLLLVIVLSLVPVLGSIAVLLLGPVALAGFMIGANDQAEGGDFTIGHLFSAVDRHLGQLLLVAVLYLVASIGVVLLGVAVVGASLVSLMAGAEAGAMPDMLSLLLATLVMMLLFLPLLMAYWFAPALVALEGLSAVEAMKHSFIGCLKNLLPMLVYGLLATVLALVAAIPLMLGFILLAPVMMASMYVAYKDIYRVEVTRFTL